MCTLVKTPDLSILLDAGVSLCPYRFGLPPHPVEFETIAELRRSMAEAADKAQVVTISHYHFDHHTPSFEDWLVNWTQANETARQIYQNKIVLLKHPREKINPSQRQRAWMFQKTGGKYAKKLAIADNKAFDFGNTRIRFSEPVAHGSEHSGLGWVIMAIVEYAEEKFMFAPDVQGPMSDYTSELIQAAQPTVIMLGGPPFYLEGTKVDVNQLDLGLKNLENIVKQVPVVILEHHALRDELWRNKTARVYEAAEKFGHSIMTAAEFRGNENRFLEYKRAKLFEDFPTSLDFTQWTKTLNSQKVAKPPL